MHLHPAACQCGARGRTSVSGESHTPARGRRHRPALVHSQYPPSLRYINVPASVHRDRLRSQPRGDGWSVRAHDGSNHAVRSHPQQARIARHAGLRVALVRDQQVARQVQSQALRNRQVDRSRRAALAHRRAAARDRADRAVSSYLAHPSDSPAPSSAVDADVDVPCGVYRHRSWPAQLRLRRRTGIARIAAFSSARDGRDRAVHRHLAHAIIE